MAWQTPKTNWATGDIPVADDFNRIEGNVQELQNTKETPAGAQAKANTAEANAKAYTDAHEQKAAPHSGHETPAGAQAKAEAAAGAVQADLDAHLADEMPHSGKLVPVIRQIATSGSLSGGGDLSVNRTITHLTTAGHKHIPSGGANGQILGYGGNGTGAWVFPPFHNYRTSLKDPAGTYSWVIPGWQIESTTANDTKHNYIYYAPVFVAYPTTYDRAGIYVSTSASDASVEVRIYAWENGLPGMQVVNAGTMSATTNGAKEAIINTTLQPGYYFLACRISNVSGGLKLYSVSSPYGLPITPPGSEPARGGYYITGIAVGTMTAPARVPTNPVNNFRCFAWLREVL